MKVAIIPARGGSKRIPRKNVRLFCGRPIIEYSVKAAMESGLFDEIMVSTDDEEIAAIARSVGANVPFLRSIKNSDDFSSTAEVLIEVINTYSDRGKFFDIGCCIYPTASFVTPSRLKQGFTLLQEKQFDVVFPICSFSYPILRSLKMEDSGKVEMNWPAHLNSRSQDLPKAYHDAGQFYWFDSAKLKQTNILFGKNSGGVEISEMEVQDIDIEDDWKIAELKYTMLHAG